MIASLPRYWRMALAIVGKEWRQVLLDPSTFGLVVILPQILMFLFGSAVSLDSHGIRTGLVDHDHSRASRELVAAFAHNPRFAVIEADSVAPLAQDMLADRMRGAVVIPQGFGAARARGKSGEIEVITDGSQPLTAMFVSGYAQGVVNAWAEAHAAETGTARAPPLALLPRYRYNPGLVSGYMLLPGAIAIIMAMIGCLLTALIMAREYERGTMEGLLSTPVPIGLLVASKLAPYFLLGLASTGFCVAVAVFGYGLPLRGSLLALLAVSSAFLAAVLGQGLLLSAATKNQFVSAQFATMLGFMPSLMLSGFLFEIDAMPRPIQWISWLVPARYLVRPLQTLFLAGDVWTVLWPAIVALLGFGALFFAGATLAIKRTIV